MPQKNKKNTVSKEPMDIISLVGKIVQDSAITIFWESVDRFKKEIKVKLEISLQFVISALVIITGLIFVLVGISGYLDEFLGISGAGYILIGILVVLCGMVAAEKAKEKNKLTKK
ncbi:MAG: hypothetical protein V1690_01850 [Candidatus Moraniibacteriota bacterium]